MKQVPLTPLLRGVAALSFLTLASAAGVSAQSLSYSYQVVNNTLSGGDPVFPVTDNVIFSNLSLTETFADSSKAFIPLHDLNGVTQTSLDALGLELDSNALTLPDPVHGALESATLSGLLDVAGGTGAPGSSQQLTLQPTLDPASRYTQWVYGNFSVNLLGAPTPGIGIGQFSLLDAGGSIVYTQQINAAPVPEASSLMSFGLLLAAGGFFLMRRRTVAQS